MLLLASQLDLYHSLLDTITQSSSQESFIQLMDVKGSAISQPQTDRACAKDAISATNIDDHFPISAFPFPLSASVFRFSFPFPFSVSSVSTCPSIMAGILTTKYPERAPDLFAYQKTIVHASRSFSGDHWVTYDLCYRRQAAATKSLRWSIIDFSLYNETFTGRARVLPRCRYCLSEHHRSSDCTFAPDQSPSTPKATPRESTSRPQICLLFNTRSGNQCRFQPCRLLYVCS